MSHWIQNCPIEPDFRASTLIWSQSFQRLSLNFNGTVLIFSDKMSRDIQPHLDSESEGEGEGQKTILSRSSRLLSRENSRNF